MRKKRKSRVVQRILTMVLAVALLGSGIPISTLEVSAVGASESSYDIEISLGENVSLDIDSEYLTQTITSSSAITDIVISADSGYGFTNDYITGLSRNGITVTREGTNQTITISGTPTADYTQTISATAQVNAQTPVFNADLVSATYDDGDTIAALDGTATVTDGGTITYQWYVQPYGGSWGNVITGGTSAKYTPIISAGNQRTYCVYAKNTIDDNGDGGKKTVTALSNEAVINVDLDWPTFNTNLSTDEVVYYYTESADALEVSASVDDGIITYQWYKSTTGTSWSAISGKTDTTYTPVTTSAGTTYYKCIATNTYNSKTMYTHSNIATITVAAQVNAETPVFDASLVAASYEYADANKEALDGTATVTDGGTVTYQWYEVGTVTDTAIGDATNVYELERYLQVGTYEYYVIATNTINDNGDGGSKTATTTSNTVTITVTPQTPTFTRDLSETAVTYYYGESTGYLKVVASAGYSNLSYQWYTSANGTDWTIMQGEKTYEVAPRTTMVGTTYYKCVVTNTYGEYTATADSKVATITVNADVPNISTDLSETEQKESYGTTATALTVSASVQDGGTITYQWYSKTTGDWAEISNATSASYTPPTDTLGTTYYKVKVINTNGTLSSTTESKTATVTVEKADQDISIADVGTVTYGDDDFTLSVSGIKESAGLSYEVTSGTAASVDSVGKVTINSAGSVTIKVTSAETTNYNSSSETITFTVEQKALSVVIDDKEIVRGMSIPTFTSTVSGNVDGDVITVSYSTTADNMTAADYAITMTNADDYTNYDISVTTGTLTVKDGYTVSFDDTDVTDIAYGATVSQPADPTKEGYIFKGWYLGDSKFDFTTVITGDLELTSTWEAVVEKEIVTTGSADVVIETDVEEQLLDELFTQEEIDLNVEMKVTVQVDIVEVIDMSGTTQTEFTSYLEEYQEDLAENETVTQAVVFDISVIKSLAGVEENITELDTPIRITIEIPEEYQVDGREFFILRNHEGEITILEDLDDDPTTITIETDRFSNYTLNYVESVEDDDIDIDTTVADTTVADTTVADTGDNTSTQMLFIFMFASLLGILVASKKILVK